MLLSYSLVQKSFETIVVFTKQETVFFVLVGRGKRSCIMRLMALKSAFRFQGHNCLHDYRKALGPDVLMFIVVVRMNVVSAWCE